MAPGPSGPMPNMGNKRSHAMMSGGYPQGPGGYGGNNGMPGGPGMVPMPPPAAAPPMPPPPASQQPQFVPPGDDPVAKKIKAEPVLSTVSRGRAGCWCRVCC